jgi:drug/metabolite transporter (DMT)-like permease
VTVALGVALASLSALVSNVGFLLRHRGAIAAPAVDVRRPMHSAIALFREKWWTVGYALAVVAYLLHVGALSVIALSLVQAVLAGGLVLLAVIAERFFGFELQRRQWAGVVLAAAALALLSVTGEARPGQEGADYSVAAMIAFECALAGIGIALILSYRVERLQPQRGVLLGAAAGLLFTVTHVAVKAMSGALDKEVGTLLLSPYLLIAVVGGVAAFFASARSLQIGPAVPVIAFTSIAGNASSIPAGIVVFGDPLGDDALSVVFRCIAFVLVMVAATLIPAPTRAADPGAVRTEDASSRREPAAVGAR